MPRPALIHVYPAFHRRGGVERFLWELVRRQVNDRSVTVVTNTADPTTGPTPEIFRVSLPMRGAALRVLLFALRATAQVSRWLRTRPSPVVVHTQGASSLGSDVITAHSCHKAWFKLSLGSLSPWSAPFWLKLLNPVHHVTILIETLQYRPGRYRELVAVSAAVKDELIRYFHVPAQQVTVIHNGVDLDEFRPANDTATAKALRSQWGCRPDAIILLFAANEFRRKGLSTILTAMAQTGSEAFHLVVAGRDDPSPFRHQIERLGLTARVTFLGPVHTMADFYRAGDIFVFPTLYEPFGMVVLEAMACGLPVVTSRLAGVAEIMTHGRDGILIDTPESATELAKHLAILTDSALRRSLGIAARQTAEGLSWDKMTEAYDRVYDRCTTTGR